MLCARYVRILLEFRSWRCFSRKRAQQRKRRTAMFLCVLSSTATPRSMCSPYQCLPSFNTKHLFRYKSTSWICSPWIRLTRLLSHGICPRAFPWICCSFCFLASLITVGTVGKASQLFCFKKSLWLKCNRKQGFDFFPKMGHYFLHFTPVFFSKGTNFSWKVGKSYLTSWQQVAVILWHL